jgi:TATA-box binding protein (TBP) (component of TFIID and TFIIIB)
MQSEIIIPKPTELEVSTMTCLCLLNTEINLDILSRFIPVYSINDEIVNSDKGGIVYVEYFMLLPRGQYCGKKAKIKEKELQINLKIRKILEGEKEFEDCFLGDPNFKDPDPTKSKKRKKKTIKKRQFENQATLIFHFGNGRYVNIKVFNNGKIQMTGVRSKEEAQEVIIKLIEIIKSTCVKQVDIDADYEGDINKITPTYLVKNDYLYTKVSNNNKVFRSIQINGEAKWIETDDDRISTLKIGNTIIPNTKDIRMSDFKIVMINSDYEVGFNIDRAKLHQILKRKYNIYATLESTYQAVKSYYFFNDKRPDQHGACKCEVPCFVMKEQNKDKDMVLPCAQVTIAVFRTGSVIITGGSKIEQTREAYDFINQVIHDNFKIIYQDQDVETIKAAELDLSDPINKIKMIMIERANENRRRAKKKVEPKKPKEKKVPEVPVVKGKRGRKPKSLTINVNQLIDSPYNIQPPTLTGNDGTDVISTDVVVNSEQNSDKPVTIKKERKKYEKKNKAVNVVN